MSMMFNALRALEMEREQQESPFLSGVQLFASTVSAEDFSACGEFPGQQALKAVQGHQDTAIGRSKMDREQLEELRRQVEEDYKLDIAAIERLQQRYSVGSSSVPSSTPRSNSLGAYSEPDQWANLQSRAGFPDSPLSPSAPADRQSDDLGRFAQSNERWPQEALR